VITGRVNPSNMTGDVGLSGGAYVWQKQVEGRVNPNIGLTLRMSPSPTSASLSPSHLSPHSNLYIDNSETSPNVFAYPWGDTNRILHGRGRQGWQRRVGVGWSIFSPNLVGMAPKVNQEGTLQNLNKSINMQFAVTMRRLDSNQTSGHPKVT